MQATIQVLLKDGKMKLTTTRIAERAGVSVGTLYQYFPNKSSLIQALLKKHLDGVALAMGNCVRSQPWSISCEDGRGDHVRFYAGPSFVISTPVLRSMP